MNSFETITALFSALGAIATAVMCFLTWKMLRVSQKQFIAMNAGFVVAELAWHGDLVLFILENTGAVPVNDLSVEFPQWFNEALDSLNNGDYVKPMVDKLRNNKRPLQGHSRITFLLCRNKTSFYEKMSSKKSLRVSLNWRNMNGEKRENVHDIDLVDEIILESAPLERIASDLHKISSTGIVTHVKDDSVGVYKVTNRNQKD